MPMRNVFLQIVMLGTTLVPAWGQSLVAGGRHTLSSQVLGEERAFQIFLPSTYHTVAGSRYAVLYMVDGDYNFHYVSGLIEQMAAISEQIPELMLVAIGDQGKKEYRRYMSPTIGEKGGEATKFMEFLERELIPHVDATYRTASYRLLAGHSMGGLFTVATLLEKPDLFQSYVAISPSMWWQDFALNRHAETVFAARPEIAARLYVSLADERGMGVFDFVHVLDRAAPARLEWSFKYEPSESHGSIGLPTLRWALLQELAGYGLSAQTFYGFEHAGEIIVYYRQIKERLGFEVLLPATMLASVLHFYRRKDQPQEVEALQTGIEEHFPTSLPLFFLALAELDLESERWQEALTRYQAVIATNPESFEGYRGAAKAFRGLGRLAEAQDQMQKARRLAEQSQARRWQLNQLEADQAELEGMD